MKTVSRFKADLCQRTKRSSFAAVAPLTDQKERNSLWKLQQFKSL